MKFAKLRSEIEELFNNRLIRLMLKILLLPLFFLLKLLPFKKFHIDHLEIVVGSKCSLHCKRCANLMQYYEHPVEFPLGELKADCLKLLELDICFDCVHLIGGEPLLYKGLPELITLLNDSGKVKNIRVITNGTIMPSNSLLKYLQLRKVHVLISNYIHIGAKTNEVYQFLKRSGVNTRITTAAWFNYHHNFSGYNRSPEELKKTYSSCCVACHEMLNGEIHLCPTSAHGMYLGLIPRDENSFVSIRHNGSKQEKRKVTSRLKRLLNQQVPNACDYCSGNNGELVPVAEQLPTGTYLDSYGCIIFPPKTVSVKSVDNK